MIIRSGIQLILRLIVIAFCLKFILTSALYLQLGLRCVMGAEAFHSLMQ